MDADAAQDESESSSYHSQPLTGFLDMDADAGQDEVKSSLSPVGGTSRAHHYHLIVIIFHPRLLPVC